MKVLLLVNSSASSVTARSRVVIQKALSADHDVETATTSRRGHATRLAQGAAAEGVDAVVVLGGDGTLNEAANGLAGSATALGVLPGGSTNVFARTIGMTNPAQVRLSWPTNYPGFQLLRASAVDGSESWSNHPMSPVVMGSNYTVTQPAATNREFFRLKQP